MIAPRKKRVKVIATIGPATDSKRMIVRLAQSGVNVFRLNLSHRTPEESLRTIKLIQAAEKTVRRPLGILADLAGPKIRIQELKEDITLENGQMVHFTAKKKTKEANTFTLNFPAIIKQLRKGTTIFLGDGHVILRVIKREKGEATARVVVGGTVRGRMGFLAQGMALKGYRMSAKDKKDISVLSKAGVSAFGISFVQNKKDIEQVAKLLPEKNRPMLFAKFETEPATKNAEEVIEAADGIMIARGDLGLSIPMERIPLLQKQLIAKAMERSKPVIVATQMLNSMAENPLPTRAEVADVAKAIVDGTDAIMFSNETAIGKYPQKVAQMARSIIASTEANVKEREFPQAGEVADAVSASVVRTAKQVGAKMIIVFTESGKTAQRISRHRVGIPIMASSPRRDTATKLNFSWGVYPRFAKSSKIHSFRGLTREAQKIAKQNRIIKLKKGDTFVISAGVPFGKSGTTNLMLIETVE